MKYPLLFAFCFLGCLVFAQNDSTLLLSPERLTEQDIVVRDLSLQPTRVISATRSLEEADQMPFSIWVATAEDIQRNGFVTLGDVLRAAPGIRVSQPGNALEGETFLMRGLAGNQFVKILINDVPIKPFLALGMPIGAQLPIRQAERIEVIYGPAGVLYGNEACAGVINIILKESERPVYTQADLSFGRFGNNNLDLTFGGKLGKDKKIFRFSLYGSSTVREKTDIYYDQTIYNTDAYVPQYAPAGFYLDNPNYRRSDAGNIPKTSPIMHESRMFGVNLKWRGLQFSYHRMARFDHSALGMNPLAVSYANSSNRIAENHEVFVFSFQKQRKRWVTYNTASFLRYKINNTSTTTFIYDRLAAGSYLLQSTQNPTATGLLDSVYQKYNAEERYGYANGFDARFETRIHAALHRHLALDLGLQFNVSNGFAYYNHHKTPVEAQVFNSYIQSEPLSTTSRAGADLAPFGQLKWQSKALTVIGGVNMNIFTNDFVTLTPLPRLAAQYRFFKHWTLRANYAKGIRHTAPYYQTNTNIISPQNGNLSSGLISFLKESEYSRAAEAAIRFEHDFRLEGVFFWQEASNMVRPNQFKLTEDGYWLYGYQNIPGPGMKLWGIQGLLRSENKDLVDLTSQNRKKMVISSRMEFFLQYARGKEWLAEGAEPLDEVMNQPRWHTQFRTFFKLNQLELMFASNRQTSVLSKSVAYRSQFQLLYSQERYPTFRSWDMSTRIYLSNHFLIYMQIQNMFNRRFAGLDATGTPDDLLFNPQQGRIIRFGVNYNMN
ncbi:MAG: TonB-dependent receptor plug domain-containing protein [Saprospiraceae bacterium]|nr:TonB-dependent receptor plug domain-containing protein [Saprospiraceae bacterium]